MKLSALACLLLIYLVPFFAYGEIYKYKDKNGNWQFSDTPPAGKQQVQALQESAAPPDVATKNLRDDLIKKFKPKNHIEKATVAVVKIKTLLGSGSGFFISETGYLITNKHVIRPPKSAIDQVDEEIKKSESILAQKKSRLSSEKSRLRNYKQDLNDYKNYVQELSGSDKARAEKEYQSRKKNYNKYKKDVAKFSKQVKTASRKFLNQKNNYTRRRANASIARQFTVLLKDDTELSASLVKISNTHDLALLKVDGHTVPHISMPTNFALGQGSTVFAIGSPLGKKDYVTSGIITSFRKDKIIFDAQILPGNSGGPLINESGGAIGVNTWKQLSTNSIGSEGFGIAIPINIVSSEFPDISGEQHQKPVTNNALQNNPAQNDLMDSILNDYKNTQQ